MTYPLVLVELEDSVQASHGWQWLSDANIQNITNCSSVGFLIKDDDEAKVLVANFGDMDTGHEQVMGLIKIPTRAVIRMTHLQPVLVDPDHLATMLDTFIEPVDVLADIPWQDSPPQPAVYEPQCVLPPTAFIPVQPPTTTVIEALGGRLKVSQFPVEPNGVHIGTATAWPPLMNKVDTQIDVDEPF